jgi:NADH-quinone oxidoreductase subunit L
MGTVKSGQVGLAAVALFTALLTMLYLLKVFSMVFLGEAKTPAPEGTRSMVSVVGLLAFLSLVAGIFVAYPTKIVQAATTHIMWWLK